jgi:FKBP-type peptidyl-prolyl cis-trans isomerase
MKYFSIIAILALSIAVFSCGSSKESQKQVEIKKLPTGVEYEEIMIGNGPMPVEGKKVSVHYIWKTQDGTLVENTYDSGRPHTFVFGSESTLAGLNDGIRDMKKGGKRKLYIPPERGYGDRTFRNVPPNSTMIMIVELVDVEE